MNKVLSLQTLRNSSQVSLHALSAMSIACKRESSVSWFACVVKKEH